MFQWESYVSLGVLLLSLGLLLVLLLLQEVLCLDQCLQKFINKTLQGGKRLLFNSDPWPPAEQKLEMPCDIRFLEKES